MHKHKIKNAIKDEIIKAFHQRNDVPDIFDNTLDIFGAVVDSKLQRIDLKDWKDSEETRKTQKTLQNIIGKLHQIIIGTFDGWDDLGTGNVVDVINKDIKIIAEIKNKHNTTKGNHKVSIYDDLEHLLETEYTDYTGYYVEILPKDKKVYNAPFTPSDNKTSTRRTKNEKIRVIDGKSFYELITGNKNAIKEMYTILPDIIDEILCDEKIIDNEDKYNLNSTLLEEFYEKTYT